MGSASVYYTISENHTELEFDVRQSKPTPSHPSSTKPEKEAIIDTLQSVPKHIKLEVRSDSANALHEISKLTTTIVQDRQLLKMNNHVTLSSLKHEYEKFDIQPKFTKVKAHTDIEGNECADKEANLARFISQPTLPYLDPIISNSSANTFLHEAGTLIEKYPAQFIKNKNRNETRENLQDKLIKYHNSLKENLELFDEQLFKDLVNILDSLCLILL